MINWMGMQLMGHFGNLIVYETTLNNKLQIKLTLGNSVHLLGVSTATKIKQGDGSTEMAYVPDGVQVLFHTEKVLKNRKISS